MVTVVEKLQYAADGKKINDYVDDVILNVVFDIPRNFSDLVFGFFFRYTNDIGHAVLLDDNNKNFNTHSSNWEDWRELIKPYALTSKEREKIVFDSLNRLIDTGKVKILRIDDITFYSVNDEPYREPVISTMFESSVIHNKFKFEPRVYL